MARKPPRRSGRRNLIWTRTGEADDRDCAPSIGEGDRGEQYVISGSGDAWDVSVTLADGTATVLASGIDGTKWARS